MYCQYFINFSVPYLPFNGRWFAWVENFNDDLTCWHRKLNMIWKKKTVINFVHNWQRFLEVVWLMNYNLRSLHLVWLSGIFSELWNIFFDIRHNTNKELSMSKYNKITCLWYYIKKSIGNTRGLNAFNLIASENSAKSLPQRRTDCAAKFPSYKLIENNTIDIA